MTRQERAAQFMAFDAMKGLQEALRDREERHQRKERRTLSEEESERLNRKLNRLRTGMRVSIDCYAGFHDQTFRGNLDCIDCEYGFLIVDHMRVYFEDVYAVRVLEVSVVEVH